MAMALFAAHRILQSTHRVLYLAGGLVGLAFGFQFLVAESLPGRFLYAPFYLRCRTYNSIFIHGHLLAVYRVALDESSRRTEGWRLSKIAHANCTAQKDIACKEFPRITSVSLLSGYNNDHWSLRAVMAIISLDWPSVPSGSQCG